jgi:hypothetical protein
MISRNPKNVSINKTRKSISETKDKMTSKSSISKMTSTKIILMALDEFEIEEESKPHSTAADPGWVSAVESQSRSL